MWYSLFCLYLIYSRIFNDFGSKFEIIDTTGEEPLHGMVANISKVIYTNQLINNVCNAYDIKCIIRRRKVLLPV